MNHEKFDEAYQKILLEINIKKKETELLAMIKNDADKSCSDCSRITCRCPIKPVTDSGIDENMSEENDKNACNDKASNGRTSGDITSDESTSDEEEVDTENEDREYVAYAVFQNYREFFGKFISPPAKELPTPKWAVANNEENPRSLTLESRVIHAKQRDITDEESFGASTSTFSLKDSYQIQTIKNSNQPPSNKTTIKNRNATTEDSTTVAEFFKQFAFSGPQLTSTQTAPVAAGSNVSKKLNPFF